MIKTVGVIGMGYVGIAEAIVFSKMYNVIGFQRDSKTSGWKVDKLNAGIYPLDGEEPEIEDKLKVAVSLGRLGFTNDFTRISECDAILIAVQTPLDKLGRPDRSNLMDAVESCGKNMKWGTLVVIVSTVVPGTTGGMVYDKLCTYKKDFLLAHAPERVMPGKIMSNMKYEARAIGGINQESTNVCVEMYYQLFCRECQYNIIPMSALEAEVCKTAENGIRDIQIAVANQLAIYCESFGINFYKVKEGIDSLKPTETRALLKPGFGVGGHCIPKDGILLLNGLPGYYENIVSFFNESRRVNDFMPHYMWNVVNRIVSKVESSNKPHIALFGISYIGDSEDTRNSPSLMFKKYAERDGASVGVFDPILKVDSLTGGIDAIVVATDHNKFNTLLSPELLEPLMSKKHKPIIVDGRNIIDTKKFIDAGWLVWCIGRGDINSSLNLL